MGFRHRWLAGGWTLATAAIVASGCGPSSVPVGPVATRDPLTAQASRDIAQHFATTLARGGVPIDQVGPATVAEIAQNRGPAQALRAGSLVDEGSFNWSLSVRFFDAAGNPQPIYVDGSTARVKITARARGTLASAEHRASVGIFRFLDVQGLLPAETTLQVDGAAHDTASCAFTALDASAERRYQLLSAGTIEALRQLKDSAVNPYPLSGMLRIEVDAGAFEQDAEGEREAHYEASVVITFNGTRHPTIEVDQRWRYRMDLDTGEMTELPA